MKKRRLSKKTLPAQKDYWKGKKILITDSEGFLGAHLLNNLLTKRHVSPQAIKRVNTNYFNLRDLQTVLSLMEDVDVVLHIAADIGGIAYSKLHPATQMRNCLSMDMNVFEAASLRHIQKLVCLSSAVAYPEHAESPLQEEDLYMGWPAKGGYGYGFAKRMAPILAKAYKEEKNVNAVVLLGANPYGPGDDFSWENSHVVSALIRKCLELPEVVVWGDGSQVRDFIYVKDLAEAVVLAAEKGDTTEPINISSGSSASIKDILEKIVTLTNFSGPITFDSSKPSGQKERVLRGLKAKKLLGFTPEYSLEKGLQETIDWYKTWMG